MPTFIDESGDTGPYTSPARRYFRLAAVWVPQSDVEVIRESIRAMRNRLGLRSNFEFKFCKTGNYPERRLAFFQTVMPHNFLFAFSAIDKSRDHWRDADRHAILWAATTELAATLRPIYLAEYRQLQQRGLGSTKELIVVDDNQDQKFLKIIEEQFRALGQAEKTSVYLVSKVKFRNSAPDELIQLADMVCGAVGWGMDGNDNWYKMISERHLGSIYENG